MIMVLAVATFPLCDTAGSNEFSYNSLPVTTCDKTLVFCQMAVVLLQLITTDLFDFLLFFLGQLFQTARVYLSLPSFSQCNIFVTLTKLFYISIWINKYSTLESNHKINPVFFAAQKLSYQHHYQNYFFQTIILLFLLPPYHPIL